MVVGGVERGAEYDDPAALGDGPDDGVQGGVHPVEVLDGAYAGGVQDDGGGPPRGLVGGESGAGEDGGEGEAGGARGEVEQPAVQRRPLGRSGDQRRNGAGRGRPRRRVRKRPGAVPVKRR